jgi:hypothetical protein
MILKRANDIIGQGPLHGGHWRDPQGNTTFTFLADGDAQYQLTFTRTEMLKLGSELLAEAHAQVMADKIRSLNARETKRFLGRKNGKV